MLFIMTHVLAMNSWIFTYMMSVEWLLMPWDLCTRPSSFIKLTCLSSVVTCSGGEIDVFQVTEYQRVNLYEFRFDTDVTIVLLLMSCWWAAGIDQFPVFGHS